MSTPLGYGKASQIILHFTASAAITKGQLVAYNWAAAADQTDVPITTHTYNSEPSVEVKPGVVDDMTTLKQQIAGVAMADAAAGEIVPVCVLDLSESWAGATIAASLVANALTCDANGDFIECLSGTHQSPCAILLEASTDGALSYISINGITVTKLDIGATTTDAFMGKTITAS